MSHTLIFDVQYYKSNAAFAPSATPTITVVSLNRTDSTVTAVVTGVAMSPFTGITGAYFYKLTGADLNTYYYRALASTADSSVDQPDQPSAWAKYSEAVANDAAGGVPLSVGTAAGQLNVSGGKAPATLAGADMSGNPPTDWLNAASVKADAVTKIQTGLATPTNITAGTMTTVTNLTNLPAIPNNWLTAAGLAADAATEIAVAIQAGILDEADGQTVLAAIVAKINATDVDLAGLSVAAITTAVAAQITTDHGSGSYVRNTEPPTVVQVRQEMDSNSTKLANLDAAVSSRMATFVYTAAPTAAVNAAAVWDLATSGHTTAGTFGNAMNAAGSAGDPWATALPGSYSPGQAGKILGDNLNATVSSRSTYAGGVVAGVTAPVTVGANNDKAGYKLAADGLDAIVIETGVNARQALSPILAAAAGVLIGAGTGTIVIKGGNVATTRITATTDESGNRSSVTLALPG